MKSEIIRSDGDGTVRPMAERAPDRWRGLAMPEVPGEVVPAIPIGTADTPARTAPAMDDQAQENSGTAVSSLIATTKPGQLLSDLAEIRAVDFCCDKCQTVVSLPRIRWVNTPEDCPNCGARWMRKPSPDSLLPEDDSTYVYRVVSSFREALQRLISVKRSVAFRLLLEIDESPNHKPRNLAESRRNGRSHA